MSINLDALKARLAAERESKLPIQYSELSEYDTLSVIFGLYIRNRNCMYRDHLQQLKIVLDSWYIRNPSVKYDFEFDIPHSYKSYLVAGLRYDIQQIAQYLGMPERYIEFIFDGVIRNECANSAICGRLLG